VIGRAGLVALALLAAVSACSDDGGGAGSSPTPVGLDRSDWVATAPDGSEHRFCAWRADTPELRARGLMGVTSMGDCPAMAFVYDAPVQQPFYMFRTTLALSIAWFAANGTFVSATDMPPCSDAAAEACPRYPAAGPFTVAIEVPRGGLDSLGLTPGSTLAPA
jgi:uncharacterized membrane protein (UPF0127 family)